MQQPTHNQGLTKRNCVNSYNGGFSDTVIFCLAAIFDLSLCLPSYQPNTVWFDWPYEPCNMIGYFWWWSLLSLAGWWSLVGSFIRTLIGCFTSGLAPGLSCFCVFRLGRFTTMTTSWWFVWLLFFSVLVTSLIMILHKSHYITQNPTLILRKNIFKNYIKIW